MSKASPDLGNPIPWRSTQDKGVGVVMVMGGTLAVSVLGGPVGVVGGAVICIGTYAWGKDDVDALFEWLVGNGYLP